MAQQNLTDTCPMPFGVHKDKKMEDVPANYLLYLYDEDKCGNGNVRAYIEENLDTLRLEDKRDTRKSN